MKMLNYAYSFYTNAFFIEKKNCNEMVCKKINIDLILLCCELLILIF